MSVTTKGPTIAPTPSSPEVLIKEARRRGRHHRAAMVLLVAALVASVIAGVVIGFGGSRSGTGKPRHASSSPGSVPIGAAATVGLLGRGSSIWVVDMLSTTDGYAIAARHGINRVAFLVATSNGGHTWRVKSRLPYGLSPDTFAIPSLAFVNGMIGYTQSGVAGGTSTDRGVYVTTDGGLRWLRLSIAGYTPNAAGDNLFPGSVNESYQVAGGVLSLVALKCTAAELEQGGSVCPSTLEQYKVGATRPFSTWNIPSIGSELPQASGEPRQAARVPSDRLLAAVSPSTVIVAQGDLEAWNPVLISTNGGRSWAKWATPCGQIQVGRVRLQLPIQELDIFAPHRWLLDCWQPQGMNQGAIVVSITHDQGRSWQLLSSGSFGASAGGIPFVGTIGDEDETLWASRDGRVLWAWDSSQGWFSESIDGGRDWHKVQVGGPPTANLSPVGPHGAILIVLGKAFETVDGTHWRHVRLLPVH